MLLLIFSANSQSSLVNTKWKGKTEFPSLAEVQLEFKTDSFSFFFSQDTSRPELMTFSQRNDSLLLKKISGISPCADGTEAWYRIEWLENGEKFLLHDLSDICRGRVRCFTTIKITERIR